MPDKTKSVSSKAAEAPGDQAARVRDMCYQIPAKGGYPLVAVPAAPSERGDEQIPWDKLTTLTNKVCDRYWISHYPEESPGDFDFCEGSIAWLAVEAYRLGRARLSSQEGK